MQSTCHGGGRQSSGALARTSWSGIRASSPRSPRWNSGRGRLLLGGGHPAAGVPMIDGVKVRPLKPIHDERGYLMEMLRSDWPEFSKFGQVYVTIAYPNVVKGWHYHKVQTDNFVVVKGAAKVVCYDNRSGSKTKGEVNEFFPGEGNPILIQIPPFVVHGFKAIAGVKLPVYGTGRNRREWIHAEDHGSALFALLTRRGVEGETFNIGTGERRSTLDVAAGVVDALDKPRTLIGRVADRPGHVASHAVDSGKLRRATAWRPRRSFDRELPKVVAWYAEHVPWWRATILGSARAYFVERYPGLVPAVASME
ncbi:MAG: NAD-dependent epimerase/dehydratase family protein [Methanobacteriota archaeon]|nr:MAG: NAD-dependent epimerase/dehydratase family protein [Euryarchaeota archaeon]